MQWRWDDDSEHDRRNNNWRNNDRRATPASFRHNHGGDDDWRNDGRWNNDHFRLVGYYAGENNANDSASGNNGTIFGPVSFSTGQVGLGFNFPGPYTKFTFTDGTSAQVLTGQPNAQGIRLADTPALQLTGPLTLSAWINVSALPLDDFTGDFGKAVIVARGDRRTRVDTITGLTSSTGLDPYKLYVNAQGDVVFHVESLTAPAEIKAGLQINTWVLVTATLDSAGVMKLYENSTLVANTITGVRPEQLLDGTALSGVFIGDVNPAGTTTTTTGGTTTTTGGTTVTTTGGTTVPIGTDNELTNTRDQEFAGLIDEVRIYNRALAPTEVNTLFQAGLAGTVATTSGGATSGGTTTTGGPPSPFIKRKK